MGRQEKVKITILKTMLNEDLAKVYGICGLKACHYETGGHRGRSNDQLYTNKIYIVGGGDEKASKGMADLAKVLRENNARMESASWSAKLPQDEQERRVMQMLQSGNPIHFISFTPGSVLAEEGKGMEHMKSFDYAYKLQTVRDWLFEQKK